MKKLEKTRLKIFCLIGFFVFIGFGLAASFSPYLGVPVVFLSVMIGMLVLTAKIVCPSCGSSLIMSGLIARWKIPDKCPECHKEVM